MKFRIDFITNSSSESYFSVTLNFIDSYSQEFEWDGTGWYDDNNFWPDENEVYFLDYPIKTIDELLACLYFYDYGNSKSETSLVPVFTSIFRFLAQKTDFQTMMKEIGEYKQEKGESLNWGKFDSLRKILPDDHDDEGQLCKVVRDLFDNVRSDKILDLLINLSQKYKSLTDLESIVFYEDSRDWGEFLNHFYERLPDEDVFPQRDKDDPLFEKEVNKWAEIINKNIFFDVHPGLKEIELDSDIDVEAALESGNIDDCLSEICGANTYTWDKFYVTQKTDTAETTPKGQEHIENIDMSDTVEHDFYLNLDKYTEDFYYQTEYEELEWLLGEIKLCSEQLKAIVEGDNFPKQFTKYPITDILDRIISYVWKRFPLETEYEDVVNTFCNVSRDTLFSKYETNRNPDINIQFNESEFRTYIEALYDLLTVLPGAGLELDFADVGHYIYTDSLETIYPFFDRGLKIEASAYDDLITYASEHGKPEYTAWLLDRKNKSAQGTDSFE